MPPELLESWQSVSSTPGRGAVTLRVRARPPRDGTLTFTWQSLTGAFEPPRETATTSEITWTAPPCGTGLSTHLLQSSIRHSSGLSATSVFRISVVCPQWIPTSDMGTARHDHTASVLPSGRVLVVGRYSGDALDSVEEYDPTTSTWIPRDDMHWARRFHTASVLPSGKVLVTGGSNNLNTIISSTELYDPVAPSGHSWSWAGDMAEIRTAHTATVLPSGKVLIAGGFGVSGALGSAELYDGSAAVKWSRTGSMKTGRYGHTATVLLSGKVLVVGGDGPNGALADAELYDPATGSWTAAGSLPGPGRANHTATLLPSGQVLVAGGNTADSALYDPTSGTWLAVAPMGAARAYHTATLLPSGRVLVVGGMTAIPLASTEVYDPDSRTWSPSAVLDVARSHHAACLLSSGQVLIAGGHTSSAPLASAALYEP
ncbi:Kelch repeat-containing protein [Hyalangium versicolor]|uniref:Kelch repeat-containing protein n=1 Tax=Hyalangium versicolor TaxID=2861190 RepID=UPI001CC9191B|nr:kelch motif-containing protein [Hyalangium versicolor]